ncbi:MAG: hypothetical protein Q9219_001161 [cf. Caloplaca sp. 3 TL-2023]
MSETCIVCLGDFGESGKNLDRAPSPTIKLEDATETKSKSPARVDDEDDERIAHLLPCGHNLHNGCLKPWAERANSCPICRQCFNKVELSLLAGGPVISSYSVDDRTQVADIDPSLYIDELVDDPEFPPCPVCDDDSNEEFLLSCDGCGVDYHTYCVDLDEIPRGHWFCETCALQRAIESVDPSRSSRRSHRTSDRRTRAQQRQERTRVQASRSGWARVWQSVWDRLDLDLDFPFDDEPSGLQDQRAARGLFEHRDLRRWERRLQIAERQGGANRFRETAAALLDVDGIRQLRAAREQPASLEAESQEELRAWNALEKAKEIQMDPNATRKKRRSPTASPSDEGPSTEPERPLKRPRTRRNPDLADQSSEGPAEGSSSSSSHRRPYPVSATRSEGPSFLQSLLKEVESSAPPDESTTQSRPLGLSMAGHSSPLNLSPGTSPTASNHVSPRALSATPPPSLSPRSGSPLSLTSKVEPVFPPPEFSPTRSPQDNHRTVPEWRQHQSNELYHPRPQHRYLFSTSHPHSDENSPPRAGMSLEAKEGVQKMVSAALKPHWRRSEISKDQFTDINRNVSRMLYEKVGGEDNLKEHNARETWEKMASEEVAKAVQSLKTGS